MKINGLVTRFFMAGCMAVALLGAGESLASSRGPKISLKIRDHSETDKDSGDREEETTRRLTTTTFDVETEVVTLNITAKNSETNDFKGELKWCFISNHSSGKLVYNSPEQPKLAVFCQGSKEFTLPAESVVDETVVSEKYSYEEKTVDVEVLSGNGNDSSKEYETGDVYEGYLVLFVVDGEVVAKDSSSNRYYRDEWMEQCLNPPVAKEKGKKKK